MKILITGATGLIGSALVSHLVHAGHQVTPLSRSSTRASRAFWNADEQRIVFGPNAQFDAVIHLAGENIAQRWSASAKERIRKSRIETTNRLAEALTRLTTPPRAFLCASATGYYGDRGEEILTEQSPLGEGFLAQVCRDWEAAASRAEAARIRVVNLRFGIVLSERGGALRKMVPIFRLGLGGKIGTGKQFWSWISLSDVLSAIEFALSDDRITGPLNIVSPEPVRNEAFTRSLASTLHRPAFMRVPALAVKLGMGEMGKEALLASFRVAPAKLQAAGFRFQHPELAAALAQEFMPRGRE